MKQYRLKKWYPSLPKDWKVGMLCTKKDEDDIDYNPDFVGYEHYTILRTQVENNPKLWAKGDVHNFFVSVGFDQVLHYTQLFLTYYWLI